jgi:hypothetical protein
MPAEIPQEFESLRLPKNWHSLVRTAVLNVLGIVRIAMLAGREALIKNGDSKDARIHQLESEVAMLREELRITGARMQRVPPHRRPQYTGIPEDQADFERDVGLIVDWYNEHRPHATLGGRTPNEVHFSRPATNEQPRIEPRKGWPRGSPCAKPQVAVNGNPGDAMVIELDCLENRRHLPVIRVRRVA